MNKHIINDTSLLCQELDLNSPIEANMSTVKMMSWAIDKIFEPKDYYSDMELIARQHEIVEGLKCQNGCDEYATEKAQSTAKNGLPCFTLICDSCAFGEGVE